jgi:hypothetical protein
MAKDIWGVLRTTGLVMLCVFDFLLLVLLAWQAQWWWFAFFTGITLQVIGFEIAGVLTQKKTISTMYREFLQKNPIAGYAGLILFGLAMAGLILHLAVWGGMFG